MGYGGPVIYTLPGPQKHLADGIWKMPSARWVAILLKYEISAKV